MPEPRYTHGHDDSVLRSHRWRTAENSAAYLLEHLRPGMDVLDVGCGPGTITIDLAARVAPGLVKGVDASEEVIRAASVAAAGLPTPVVFVVDDAYHLDAADGSVDVVHAHQVLQHLDDPVAALREWGRVVRPGGLVAARDADYAAMTWHPASPVLDRWLELYRVAARRNRGEPDAGRRMLAWAHAAGFVDVRATASVWCFTEPDDKAWWSQTWAERFTSSAVARQLLEQDLADRHELAAIAEGFRAWADHPDAWFLVPHGEIVCRVAGRAGS
jgi:SAM-dependent methyltransferase